MIYNLGGRISQLDLYWEAKTQTEHIEQIDMGGLSINRWQDLDVSKIKYWGIVCKQGKIGFDLEKNTIVINKIPLGFATLLSDNSKFDIKTIKLTGDLCFERKSILVVGDNNAITIAVYLGIGDIGLNINFYPDLRIDIISSNKKETNTATQKIISGVGKSFNLSTSQLEDLQQCIQ